MIKYKNYATMDRRKNSDDNATHFEGESMAIQSQRDEADINTIVKNFGVTGQLPQGIRMPTYGDFYGANDYQSALAAIAEADASFMAMPANVRERFGNDPQQFLEFCADYGNIEEMRKLGLAVPEPVEKPAEG